MKLRLLLIIACVSLPFLCQSVKGQQKSKEYSNTAQSVASRMYPGWNLGNTMEATGDGLAAETSWQTTKTTQEIISFVQSQGFRSVRIPCSWDIHSDQQGRIDPQWLARVKEIVDACIGCGLYVVLNDHWDNGWIEVKGFSKTDKSYEKVDEQTIRAKIQRLQGCGRRLPMPSKTMTSTCFSQVLTNRSSNITSSMDGTRS